MNTDKFLEEYIEEINKKTDELLERERRSHEEYMRSLNTAKSNSRNRIANSGADELMLIPIFMGAFLGLVACFPVYRKTDSAFTGIITFIGVWILSIVIPALIISLTGKPRADQIDKAIKDEPVDYANKVKKIKEDRKAAIEAYTTEFEQSVLNECGKFAHSDIVDDIVSWLAELFINKVNSADRSSHIETIKVSFDFEVFDNKITCNSDVYDFKLKRISNLKNGPEQMALARTIAASLQSHLNEENYSNIETSVSTAGGRGNVYRGYVRLKYNTPNDAYIPTKSW